MALVVASLMQFRVRRNGFRWAAVPQLPLAVYLVWDRCGLPRRTIRWHNQAFLRLDREQNGGGPGRNLKRLAIAACDKHFTAALLPHPPRRSSAP